MCGFFQVIQKKSEIDKDKFQKALQSMQHRGPDANGVRYDKMVVNNQEEIHIGYGHQRLSILDLDQRANQPFVEGANVLLYNGEVYNYKSIKKQYNSSISFKTDSDTEVVLHSLKMQGEKAFNDFNGMWALSFVDQQKYYALLSRDRYGKKPLFYYIDDEVFCVSSTIKAIKIYLGLRLEFNQSKLTNYLLKGNMFPSANNETHFETISQVLPGHNAIFDIKNWTIKHHRYFDPYEKKEFEYTEDILADDLKNSVMLRLTSDRPVGLLLSGGIDSSLLLSILYAMDLHENVTVYMGDTGRSDDYKYAKMCADQLGIKAKTVVSDYNSKTFERFINVCKHHEKPFPFNGNAIAMPQMYEEIAQDGVPVVLDGTGGDEIFGGYWQRHMPFVMNDAYQENALEWIEMMKIANGNKNEVKRYATDISLIKKYRYLEEDIKNKLYNQINPFIKLDSSQIWGCIDSDPLSRNNIANINYSFNEALVKDISPGGKLGDWIWHNDRNSMMHSVESRSPFLDKELHKYIFTHYSQKYHKEFNKYELRKIFDKFTPLPTQYRSQKQGFRWDGKHFFINNKSSILELMRESKVLDDYINMPLFINSANKMPKLLRSSLGKRILSVVGVEYGLNLDK